VHRRTLKTYLGYVAANVRRRRERLGLTQEELGELAGLEWRFVQRIEAGARRLLLESLVRIAEGLGVQPGRLLQPTAPARRRPGRPPARRKNSRSVIRRKVQRA
jgi:transcriptional regulator with XRE-family HTH domain